MNTRAVFSPSKGKLSSWAPAQHWEGTAPNVPPKPGGLGHKPCPAQAASLRREPPNHHPCGCQHLPNLPSGHRVEISTPRGTSGPTTIPAPAARVSPEPPTCSSTAQISPLTTLQRLQVLPPFLHQEMGSLSPGWPHPTVPRPLGIGNKGRKLFLVLQL